MPPTSVITTAKNSPVAYDRQIGNGIVVSTDRSEEYSRSARWTRRVEQLRLALPITTAVLLLVYVVSAIGITNGSDNLPSIFIRQILPTDLVMNNPTYEGFGKDGSAFTFKAKTAQQDLTNTNVVKLNTITGHITQPNKVRTNVTAARGIFDHAQNSLELFESIEIRGENGLEVKLAQATLLTKENILTSNQPSTIAFPGGSVRGSTLTLRQKAKELTYLKDVVANFKRQPPTKAKNAAGPQSGRSGLFQADGTPIQIRSERLDVNDTTQLAIFRGNVVARQGDTELETTELEAKYSGGGMMGSAGTTKNAEAQPGGAANIERIIARNTTTIRRGSDETIVGDSLEFDAPSNFATLRGNVIVTRGSDEKITSKVAQFDAASDTAVLTGDVVITRGANEKITSSTAEYNSAQNTAIVRGDVVITSGSDRRITCDQADLDNNQEMAVLTGDVVMTQGPNVLKGRRLFVNQKNGTARLTSPPGHSAGPGRIYAKLLQNSAQKAKNSARAKQETTPFGFKTNPNAPIEIDADQLDFNDPQRLIVFNGNVRAKQDQFTMTSKKLIARYKGSAGLKRIGATGQQNQKNKAKSQSTEIVSIEAKSKVIVTSTRDHTATGDWAKFDTKANKVTMGGNVVLAQGENLVRGTRLVIDMTTGKTKIDTAPPQTVAQPGGGGWTTVSPDDENLISGGGRASAVFFPRQLKDETKAAGKKIKKPQLRLPEKASKWGATLSTPPGQ